MSVINTITTIKEVHREYVLLVKIGNFYYCYGRDAYVVSYLLHYKINVIEKNIYACSFPQTAYNKVISTLEDKKINYITLDKRNNYSVDEKSNNNNLNKYNEIYLKAKEELATKMRIEKIYKYLLDTKDKEIINEMEKLINERRKIQSN
jgi:hypothetical protein